MKVETSKPKPAASANKNATPNNSDGVVPYWSSHLAGARSELVVNSDHGAQYNPQAIREVERILKLNLAVSR